MTLYYVDDAITLYHGHALDIVQTLPDQSVNCVVTSPPYFGLRDYGEPGQYGLEASPAEYVENMRTLFGEVRRVLLYDGTLWLNLGDSYNNTAAGQNDVGLRTKGSSDIKQRAAEEAIGRRTALPNRSLPAKNLLGVPWRVAFALQDDGWILRNAIVWSKPNAMPESVTDRLSTRHELVFLFSRSRRYWFDLNPIREAHITGDRPLIKVPRGSQSWSQHSAIGQPQQASGPAGDGRDDLGRNPGDVWEIATSPFPGAHFAVFPPEIPRRCIQAGCKPGGTVLDPFSGSGTTGMVAGQLGRRYIGIDLSAKYLDLSLSTRLAQGVLMDGETA